VDHQPRGHLQAGIDATNTHDEELVSKTFDEVFEPDVLFRTP
jgi:hypothetical protein